MSAIKWELSEAEQELIDAIVLRAVELWPQGNQQTFEMDVTATHCNGCPLNLDGLLHADDFSFAHDIAGIYRHMDRETGRLHGYFYPRWAAKENPNGADKD